MATQNKSECEVQQLADKTSLILKSRKHSTPVNIASNEMGAGQDDAREIMLNQQDIAQQNAEMPGPPQGLRQKLRSIPGLGYALAWCQALLRLPRTRFQTELALTNVQKQINGLQLQLRSQEQKILRMEEQKLAMRLEKYDALDIGSRLMELDRLHIGRQLRSMNLMMRAGLQNGTQPADQLGVAMTEQASQAASVSTSQPVANVASDFDQDQFYLEFEALFRGSRADIKERLKVYLPYLAHISEQAKDDRKLVIDVGCGRGEWLELLDEQGIPAMGVDMNISMVNACLDQGFLCRHADAIAYLREQPAGSIGAVTGFQIIEHLPFEQLIALFDAARHALCPGGVIIFETPNPENLKVGACNFYFDPTHLHPIVPQVAEFMARQRGFSHAEILRLHPYPDDHLLHGGTEVEALLNKELFGAQDYAVIGRK
ncbi:class I SAM-dependent methyltransferase [Undibacterium sp. Ji42W]|uniref:class I SAM-dependent methyltransferase n=1 Tax=Undibacterium sp. Ji42W TaxID=3413039 RepID=UPI003BEFC592